QFTSLRAAEPDVHLRQAGGGLPVGPADEGNDAGVGQPWEGGIALPQVGEVRRADAVIQLRRNARPLGGAGLEDRPPPPGPVLDDAVALPAELQAVADQGPRVLGVAAGPGNLILDGGEGTPVDLIANAPVENLDGHGFSFLGVQRGLGSSRKGSCPESWT